MANPEHLLKLEEGIPGWNQWRRENPDVEPDLSGGEFVYKSLGGAQLNQTNLTRANLSGADLTGANLSGADLRSARLWGALLHMANLKGADLEGARLYEAILTEANLKDATLKKANLTGAQLTGASLIGTNLLAADLERADLSGADLSGADLTAALLLRTVLDGANLTGCAVYGASVWDVSLEGAIQSKLNITNQTGEASIQVDDLEVAQFIYLLLSHRKLRDVITTLGEKAVLILGRFSERKELLDGIANKLRSLDYLPIIFDFERPTDRDLTETVRILAGLSRFVIADITNPRSVPLELQATVPEYMVPFVTILQRGHARFSMFDDLPIKYHWALPLLEYNTPESLLTHFKEKVVLPALEKLEEVRRLKSRPRPVRSAED